MAFIDRVQVTLAGGAGGKGRVHFQKSLKSPRLGPDGGDGGKGGDLILTARSSLTDLSQLKKNCLYKAEDGKPGDKNKKKGLSGQNLTIHVPIGTRCYNLDGKLVADFKSPDFYYCAVKGGKGGRGNHFFKTSRQQSPQKAQTGEPALKKEFILQLQWISDVGLVGFRSSGKTSLALALSNRREALYPSSYPRRFFIQTEENFSAGCLVDLPGLSKSCLKFLKQVERTKRLVFIISLEKKAPFLEYQKIKEKVKSYDENQKSALRLKNYIVLLIGEKTVENLKKVKKFHCNQNLLSLNNQNDASSIKKKIIKQNSVFSFVSLKNREHINFLKSILFG